MTDSSISPQKFQNIAGELFSPYKKDLGNSRDLNGRKTDPSLEPQGFISEKNSFMRGSQSGGEDFISAELDALDLSIIPQNAVSGSVMAVSVLNESEEVDNPNNLKPLVLENTGIKTRGWCRGCVIAPGRMEGGCVVM